MTDRIVQIESACRLSVRDEQLVVTPADGSGENTVPLEDLSLLLVDNQEVTFTLPAINGVTRYGAVAALCDAAHTPKTIITPLHANVTQTQRYRLQTALTETEKDAIWNSIVTAKMLNQAGLLDYLSIAGGESIRSLTEGEGVSEREGSAANIYFKALFGKEFRRDRFGAGPNPLLNYGYAVLRAATVKELLCAGLHPCFSLHHKGKYDDYPLADDVMEPFRVFVDLEVNKMWNEGVRKTDRTARERLVAVLLSDVRSGGKTCQLKHALSRTASSLVSRLKKEEALMFPSLC